MSKNFERSKLVNKWVSVLESVNAKPENYEWMAQMAETQYLHTQGRVNENAYNNLGNGYGMGNVNPANPSSNVGYLNGQGFNGTIGSGDVAQNLAPVSLKIAAQTIGLDLVPTLPANSAEVRLVFVDFPYEDGQLEGGDTEKPTLLKLKYNEIADVKASLMSYFNTNGIKEQNGVLSKKVWMNITNGDLTMTEPATKTNQVELKGFSFMDSTLIVRVYKQVNTASSGAWTYNAGANTFSATGDVMSQLTLTDINGVAITGLSASLVSALEDHIPGYVANFKSDLSPLRRGEAENTYANTIGINTFSKTVEIGEIMLSTHIKRTELEDIPQATGINVLSKMEQVLSNELSQRISREIVFRIHELGEMNRLMSAPQDVTTTPHASFGNGIATLFDFNTDYTSAIGGETTITTQRHLATAIQNASTFLFVEGRINKADFLITNYMLATALSQLKGFSQNHIEVKTQERQLAPHGSINGIKIYIDPYQKPYDNRITLGCKNKADQAGLVFIPYLMAQKIELMSEGTVTPRLFLRSRYAIADVGHYPHKQYITMYVADDNRLLA